MKRAATEVGEAIAAKADAVHQRTVGEAENGDGDTVRAHRAAAETLRRQAATMLAKADQAEAAGKAGKAARLRKVAERPRRQAEAWEEKARGESERLKVWAAEQRAKDA